MHAWQQAGYPNEWEWGGAAGSGSPGTIAGDPAAIREPGGDVAVFVTRSGGTVAATRQTAPDANTSWTAWTPVGGSCASSPVPFVASGTLTVACVTRTGTLAVTQLSGSGWSAWQLAGLRSGLCGTPAVVTAAAGQTGLFAAATAGDVDEVYQAAGSTLWTQAAGLPSQDLDTLVGSGRRLLAGPGQPGLSGGSGRRPQPERRDRLPEPSAPGRCRCRPAMTGAGRRRQGPESRLTRRSRHPARAAVARR